LYYKQRTDVSPVGAIHCKDIVKVEKAPSTAKPERYRQQMIHVVTNQRTLCLRVNEEAAWSELIAVIERLVIPWGSWTKLVHSRFPEETHRQIFVFLLIVTFDPQWRMLPRDLRWLIIGWVATRTVE